MIKRDITQELLEAAGEYSVVTLLGPRQSGKSTLVKMTFPGKSLLTTGWIRRGQVRIPPHCDHPFRCKLI